MSRKLLFLFLVMVLIPLGPQRGARFFAPAWAACEPGTKLDKTTVEDIRKLLQKAGYRDARDWRKGCDNTWHATAVKDGARVDVAVLPDGTIVREAGD